MFSFEEKTVNAFETNSFQKNVLFEEINNIKSYDSALSLFKRSSSLQLTLQERIELLKLANKQLKRLSISGLL